jgi:predicted dinucleotide-binding enzyme
MHSGLIGAGRVSQAFARHLVRIGHDVTLSNSRGPASLRDIVQALGAKAKAGTVREAAAAPLVMLGVPWLQVSAALAHLPSWNNRVLIDATNQFVSATELQDLGGQVSSELVAELAPGARVIKALNNLLVARLEAGGAVGGGQRVTFISGDDGAAKSMVGDVCSSIGFAVIDLGSLRVGGLMQQAGGPLAGIDLARFA